MSGPRLTEPHHEPGYTPKRAVRRYERLRAPNVARTTTPPVHPNCRSSTNVEVEGDLHETAQKVIKEMAEEALERSKNLLKR